MTSRDPFCFASTQKLERNHSFQLLNETFITLTFLSNTWTTSVPPLSCSSTAFSGRTLTVTWEINGQEGMVNIGEHGIIQKKYISAYQQALCLLLILIWHGVGRRVYLVATFGSRTWQRLETYFLQRRWKCSNRSCGTTCFFFQSARRNKLAFLHFRFLYIVLYG